MARKLYLIDGYPHTLDMARANQRCQREHGTGLRAYLKAWRVEHPLAALPELAAEMRVHLATLYRWLERLRLRDGAIFIDLDGQPHDEAPVATGTEG